MGGVGCSRGISQRLAVGADLLHDGSQFIVEGGDLGGEVGDVRFVPVSPLEERRQARPVDGEVDPFPLGDP
jgi:hypothetical protein